MRINDIRLYAVLGEETHNDDLLLEMLLMFKLMAIPRLSKINIAAIIRVLKNTCELEDDLYAMNTGNSLAANALIAFERQDYETARLKLICAILERQHMLRAKAG